MFMLTFTNGNEYFPSNDTSTLLNCWSVSYKHNDYLGNCEITIQRKL